MSYIADQPISSGADVVVNPLVCNLLVCKNRGTAERAINLLGLDRDVWRPHGMLDELGGCRFDRIVVIVDVSELKRHLWWFKEELSLKLPRGGKHSTYDVVYC